MPYFVALFEMIDKDKDKDILDVHIDFLNENIKKGNIFAKGPFMDHSGGLVIYKMKTFEEAECLAKSDPVIVNNTRKLIFKEWKTTLPE
ncbi:YciI family protein [Fusibacter sp. JL216-2]|uniref:YciI family protein n=1 Tax=Fusibacter sp. JL216-2 TaxID=3071453 RepID=UPI003D340043